MPHQAHNVLPSRLPLPRRTLLRAAIAAATASMLAACGQDDAPTVTPGATPSAAVATAAVATTGATTGGGASIGATGATSIASATALPATAPAATVTSTPASPASSPAAAQPAALAQLVRTAGRGSTVDGVDLAGKTVQIDFWHTQTKANAETLNKLCAEFAVANPGITVSPQYQGNTGTLAKKLLAAIAAGQPPTVSAAIETDIASFAQADALADLTPYINSKRYGWSGEDITDFFPAFLERNIFPQFGNQVLAAPFTPAILTMWYNLDLLKQLGFTGPARTWDAFKAQAAAAVKAGKRGWPVSVEASQVAAMVYSFGGDVISDDGRRALFDSPQALAALSVLEEMGKAGTARQVESGTNATDDLAQFVAGDAPFIFDTSAGRSTLAAALANDAKDPSKGFKFDWNGTIIPQGPQNPRPATVLNGANTTLFRGAPEKQLAGWLLLRHLTTRDASVTWSTSTGYLPIRRSILEADAVKRFFAQAPQNQAPFNFAPSGKGEPKVAGWTTARNDLTDVEIAVLNGKLSARDAAQRLQTKVNADLAAM